MVAYKKKVEDGPVEDGQEEDVIKEFTKTEDKVNKTPLKELPKEELTLDDKLFEIKNAVDKTKAQTLNGLQHLEKKIDFIYNMLSNRGQRR